MLAVAVVLLWINLHSVFHPTMFYLGIPIPDHPAKPQEYGDLKFAWHLGPAWLVIALNILLNMGFVTLVGIRCESRYDLKSMPEPMRPASPVGAPRPKTNRFQFSLQTAIIAMFVAGALVGAGVYLFRLTGPFGLLLTSPYLVEAALLTLRRIK